MGDPEKPGPMPVGATAAPDASTRIRGPSVPISPLITSITSTSNDEIAVPRITERPVHCMPAATCPSGMIGSPAAEAEAGSEAAMEAATRAARKVGRRIVAAE